MVALLRWIWRHLGLLAEAGAYFFWFLLDLAVAANFGLGNSALLLLATVTVPVLVLLRRRPGVDLLTVASAALAVSIGASALSAALHFHTAGPAFAELLALAFLIAEVLRRCPLRTASIVTAVAAVAIVSSPIQRMDDPSEATFAVLCALGWGGAVGIGFLLRDAETRRQAALEEVRAAERMELARELHDVVAHHVTGIIVAAQAAAVVAKTRPEEVDNALAAIEAAGSDALAAMRRMVSVLRGDQEAARTPGAELGELPKLVERFDPERRLVRLKTDPGLEHAVLPAGVAATGYRVVQEALTNVRRHAPAATTVEVDVRMRDGALLVSVRNDGVSPTRQSSSGGGFGLAGMSERIAALGGSLTAGPTEPGVWTVSARLPLGRTS